MIYVASEKIMINPRELKARLAGADDAETLRLAAECEIQVRRQAVFSYCFTETEIAEETCDVGFGPITSRSLRIHLAGCRKAYVAAATLGLGVDTLLRSVAVSSPLRHFVTDAVASALIEALCDHMQQSLPKITKPRFSPGYGDLSLDLQAPLLQFLEKRGRTGISLTESGLMIPSKSVTAIMGIVE